MRYVFPVLCITVLFSSCKPAITSGQLYGKWKYIKVENPNENPPDSIPDYQLIEQAPYIKFTQADSLIIVWGGKVLSHGKFTVSGSNIDFKEDLPDGKKRQFPFLVSRLTKKDLIFETSGIDGTRVTAVKK
jgi:hypothetical protein